MTVFTIAYIKGDTRSDRNFISKMVANALPTSKRMNENKIEF